MSGFEQGGYTYGGKPGFSTSDVFGWHYFDEATKRSSRAAAPREPTPEAYALVGGFIGRISLSGWRLRFSYRDGLAVWHWRFRDELTGEVMTHGNSLALRDAKEGLLAACADFCGWYVARVGGVQTEWRVWARGFDAVLEERKSA